MTTTILRAGTLLLAEDTGDVGAGPDADAAAGLYVADTRLLARWMLRLDGAPLSVAGAQEESSSRVTALLLPGRRHEPSPVLVRRAQRVARDGLVETITISNVSTGGRDVTVSLEAVVDFADQFAVRADGRVFDTSAAQRSAEMVPNGVRFSYRHARGKRAFTATARITAVPAPSVRPPRDGATILSWPLSLLPGQQQELEIRVEQEVEQGAEKEVEQEQEAEQAAVIPSDQALDHASVASSDPASDPASDRALLRQSLADLDALLVPSPVTPGRIVPGAGAPWFLTLFGRDSLLTADLLAHRCPHLAVDVLRDLAATQGSRDDPASLEQPGRIVHELRRSELATLGMVPYGRYYGSVDVTPLFLVVLGRAAGRPGGNELAVELEQAARAAVSWIRGPGGLEASGFVRFLPDPAGLLNQGWKDSPGSTCFADGTSASGPIALCEVQGYAWEGLTAVARLARDVWGDRSYADELDGVAVALRDRFLAAFWMSDREFPALALDGADRPADTMASNAGHLLWSGVLPRDRAGAVVRRLVGPEFFTGWGIRTVASGQLPYSALSYHNGSVWPHDTMLAALGMLRYGFDAEARTLATGVIAAGRHLRNRLPELFGGIAADDLPFPVTLERAGVPQAWAAAAGVAAVDMLTAASTRDPTARQIVNP